MGKLTHDSNWKFEGYINGVRFDDSDTYHYNFGKQLMLNLRMVDFIHLLIIIFVNQSVLELSSSHLRA